MNPSVASSLDRRARRALSALLLVEHGHAPCHSSYVFTPSRNAHPRKRQRGDGYAPSGRPPTIESRRLSAEDVARLLSSPETLDAMTLTKAYNDLGTAEENHEQRVRIVARAEEEQARWRGPVGPKVVAALEAVRQAEADDELRREKAAWDADRTYTRPRGRRPVKTTTAEIRRRIAHEAGRPFASLTASERRTFAIQVADRHSDVTRVLAAVAVGCTARTLQRMSDECRAAGDEITDNL